MSTGNKPKSINPNTANIVRDKNRKPPSADVLVEGILAGNRLVLSRAITLVESQLEAHKQTAREVIARCLPHTGKS